MRKLFLFFFLSVFLASAEAQKIQILNSKKDISLRGLSILDDKNAWVSGTKGTVGNTNDGGVSWNWQQIPTYENRDFRDIEILDSQTVIIMAIDTPAIILKTKDKGAHWIKVFEDPRPGMFLDAMSFDNNRGVVVGDAVIHQQFIATSKDKGDSWQISNKQSNESNCFASSGTNIVWRDGHYYWITGGKNSELIRDKKSPLTLPIQQGKSTTGANSIALNPNKKAKIAAIIVGGDFLDKNKSEKNCVLVPATYFNNQEFEFQYPLLGPKGYKSCVSFIKDNIVLATGTSGSDISSDNGMHWTHFSDQSFHVVQKAKKGALVLFAGPDGTIGKLLY